VHRPLARVPKNTLKFAVGVMLSAFGVFWTGEGLGVPWPGGDFAIVGFAAMFLAVSSAAIVLARRPKTRGLVMMILLRELAGLFVDDGALALAILAVVGLAGMAAVLMPNTPLAAGAVLLFGCLAALVSSDARTDRH